MVCLYDLSEGSSMGLFPRLVVYLKERIFETRHTKRTSISTRNSLQEADTSSTPSAPTAIMDPMFCCTSQVGHLRLDTFITSALPTIHENLKTDPTDTSSTASSLRRSSSVYSTHIAAQYPSRTSCSSSSARFSSYSNSSSTHQTQFGETANDSFFDFDSDSEGELSLIHI